MERRQVFTIDLQTGDSLHERIVGSDTDVTGIGKIEGDERIDGKDEIVAGERHSGEISNLRASPDSQNLRRNRLAEIVYLDLLPRRRREAVSVNRQERCTRQRNALRSFRRLRITHVEYQQTGISRGDVCEPVAQSDIAAVERSGAPFERRSPRSANRNDAQSLRARGVEIIVARFETYPGHAIEAEYRFGMGVFAGPERNTVVETEDFRGVRVG